MSRARDFVQGPKLRRYRVTLPNGELVDIEAHFCFNNADDGRGLILRRYIDDNAENRTYVVAEFAPGFWASYMEVR